MELIVLNEKTHRPYSEFKAVNSAVLALEIIKAPDDYVFILTPSEFNAWLEFHNSAMRTSSGLKTYNQKVAHLLRLASQASDNLAVAITVASSEPSTRGYRIGSLTPQVLGDVYAVFFVREGHLEKCMEVKMAIKRLRAERSMRPTVS